MAAIKLPRRSRGRQSPKAKAAYQDALHQFCAAILQINSSLDFQVASRSWCYLLEEYGLLKGDFDNAQKLIVQCRKDGLLPLDIVAEDSAREFDNLESLDVTSVEEEAQGILDWVVEDAHRTYTPISLWEDQEVFIQMVVEKVSLRNLFRPVCSRFHIPIANGRGWSDLNLRAKMMRRFARWETEGKRCVLLYCGDHDPGGLQISEFLRSNMEELEGAVGWSPDNLIIDRFGLNHAFIIEQDLTWIENLETGSGRRLDDPRHPDHAKPYVQDYIEEFGVRKVEGDALVTRVEAGRGLCRQAILKYVDEDAYELYRAKLEPLRDQVRGELDRLLEEAWS